MGWLRWGGCVRLWRQIVVCIVKGNKTLDKAGVCRLGFANKEGVW